MESWYTLSQSNELVRPSYASIDGGWKFLGQLTLLSSLVKAFTMESTKVLCTFSSRVLGVILYHESSGL
jgi:hypothetical protein